MAAYAMYTSQCERPDPGADGAKYTFPKQEFSGETTEETQITTRRHLLPDDQPVNDGNASKGGGSILMYLIHLLIIFCTSSTLKCKEMQK